MAQRLFVPELLHQLRYLFKQFVALVLRALVLPGHLGFECLDLLGALLVHGPLVLRHLNAQGLLAAGQFLRRGLL